VLDPVVFLRVGRNHALAAAALPPVRRDRQALDVAGVGHGDHHVLLGDQVLDRELPLVRHDLGPALVAEPLCQLGQLFLQDLHAPRLRGEDLLALLDELADFLELLVQLRDLEGGEPGEPHVEDFGRLPLGQLVALAQRGVRGRRVLGLLDDLDHLVDVVDGDLQALEDVLAVLGALQLELGAAGDDGVAVLDEVVQQLLQVHLLRHAVREGQHDRAEGDLHLRALVELVQHHRGDRVALQLDDEPNPFPVALVAQVGNALQLLRDHEVGDFLADALGAHLIGKLRDDDLVAAGGFLLLDLGASAHDDAAPALLIALLDPVPPVDDPARREVRALDEPTEVLHRRARAVHQVLDRLDHLAEVVRRDVGGHPDGDARRAVDDQVRQLRGKDRRFPQPVVEVGDEIDRVLVDVVQHRQRNAREARLRVAVGRRRVPVHRPEVPLPIHQRVAQRELLHHPHEGVVDRHVAVRVVLAEHIAHHRRALFVGATGHEAQFVHRVQDPAVYGLQPVAHVGQRALHDHAHRVVEERLLQLVLDEARQDAFAGVGCGHERGRCQVLGVRVLA
jgi:hypothetical protein